MREFFGELSMQRKVDVIKVSFKFCKEFPEKILFEVYS